jgi:hypothetical protein
MIRVRRSPLLGGAVMPPASENPSDSPIEFTAPVAFRRRGVEMRLVLPAVASQNYRSKCDPTLIKQRRRSRSRRGRLGSVRVGPSLIVINELSGHHQGTLMRHRITAGSLHRCRLRGGGSRIRTIGSARDTHCRDRPLSSPRPVDASLPKKKFAADSALEHKGFEPPVPLARVRMISGRRRGRRSSAWSRKTSSFSGGTSGSNPSCSCAESSSDPRYSCQQGWRCSATTGQSATPRQVGRAQRQSRMPTRMRRHRRSPRPRLRRARCKARTAGPVLVPVPPPSLVRCR